MNLYYDLLEGISNLSLIYRAALALLTSMLMIILLGKPFIYLIKKFNYFLQPIRHDGPSEHLKKQGTPTLGGILIMFSFVVSSLVWVDSLNSVVKVVLLTSLGFAAMGLLDDGMKLFFKNSKGFPWEIRFLVGLAISCYATYLLMQEYPVDISSSIYFPFIKGFYFYVGPVMIMLFGSLVILGSANSVNLTDGLDGLASLVVFTILVAFFVVLIIILNPGLYITFHYGSLFYYTKIKELMIVIAALAGGLLGFLWYNGAPAKIFMGDVGALGIGAALGALAVALKQELFLAVAGIFLICETLSVILQISYYKMTKKRIFLMAPLHHHFEKKGIPETLVVKRIWVFTVFTSLLALLLLDTF
ncbi:Phospho-N-acetylmuramoyl-pentapeptide-transferase [Candidatus Hepatincolaceae symbiont of Richtersius coronifer]